MGQSLPRIEYSNLDPPFGVISFSMDFDTLYRHYFDQLLYISMRLILLHDLPDTIEETFLKYLILVNGKAIFFRLQEDIGDGYQSEIIPLHEGDLVVMNGNKAENQTFYYQNRRVLVANPALKKSYNLTPGVDCEIVYCTEPDKYKIFGRGGLFALIARTATILADNDISINCAQKNTRLCNIIGADDAQTANSANVAIQSMYKGEPYVVAQKSLVSDLVGIPMTQRTSTSDIVQLIEMRQYIYSHFYESLGLQTHDNMKKERLITDEINDNEEISALNIDDILHTIQEGLDRVNALFGTSITAELNPIVQRAHEDDQIQDDPETDLDPEQDPEETEEVTDPFEYYDSAEIRRIIRGLKAVLDEAPEDPAAEEPDDQSEEDPEEQDNDLTEDQTEDTETAAAEDQTEDDDQTDPDPESAAEEPDDQSEEDPEEQDDDLTEDQTEDEDQSEDTEPDPEPAAMPEIKIEIKAEDEAEVNIQIDAAEGGDPDVSAGSDPDEMGGRLSDSTG